MNMAESLEGKIMRLESKIEGQQEAIQRVRELHKPYRMSIVWTACEVCRELPSERGRNYPCPTIKALDGEQA